VTRALTDKGIEIIEAPSTLKQALHADAGRKAGQIISALVDDVDSTRYYRGEYYSHDDPHLAPFLDNQRMDHVRCLPDVPTRLLRAKARSHVMSSKLGY
jgi:hypothetical protein